MSRTGWAFVIGLVALLAGVAAAAVAPPLGIALIVVGSALFAGLAILAYHRRARPLAPYASLRKARLAEAAPREGRARTQPGDVSGAFIVGILLVVGGVALRAGSSSTLGDSLLLLGGLTVLGTGGVMLVSAARTRTEHTPKR